MLPFLIVVKVPTAYIVLPHCTICRICWTGLVIGSRCGVFVTGVADTGPVGGEVANDGAVTPIMLITTVAATAPALPKNLSLLCRMARP